MLMLARRWKGRQGLLGWKGRLPGFDVSDPVGPGRFGEGCVRAREVRFAFTASWAGMR